MLDLRRRVELAEVPEHHDGRQHHGRRVDHILARVLGRRTVYCLENGDLVPEVRGRREAKSADQRGGEVADDVPVHVRGHDDLELLGLLDELVSTVVDDDVLRLDSRILLTHLLEGTFERPLGELHDVGFRRAVDAFASLGDGELERQPDDLLAALVRDELEALCNPRGLHVLDAGVEVLDVFADDHEIDAAAAVRRRHARELAHRSDVAVGLEQLAEGDVRALLAETDRRFQGALQHDAGLADRFDGFLRHAGRDALPEDARARVLLFPRDSSAGGLDDSLGGAHALGAHAISRDDGYDLHL